MPHGRPALDGIRILDFTRAQQGPFATMLLCDMGAEVIKVEPPGGEQGRANGLGPDGFSSYFEGHNRGKRSITLDLRVAEAIDIVRRLVPSCDVVVENFRPGVMEAMGLGYESLRLLRPDIILASASAWGRNGPWAERPGYDHVAQALSGVMYEQGEGPGGTPQALIGGFADQIGAMLLAFGVSTALVAREREGIGQHIDGSLIGGMVAMQSKQIMEFLRTGKQTGFERRRAATYTNYECGDGRHIAIAAQDQKYWERLCEALDEGWLKDDERFASPFPRARNKDALVGELDRIFRKRPMAEWLEPLAAAGVPHAPVLDYAGMSEHPQYWANEYLVEIETPHLGRLRVPGAPVRMSATPPRVDSAGPILGADTEDILLAAGYDWDEIAAFKECGATRTA
ncbi:MAG: CoA transferase [Dehalococcoidia bacterium]|uniref:CaiB/BaiF CoA transferase family protein n=1 Tax=Candidatus Amarobacter glycogenicus TaxID=3140699 RepID=UPI00313659B3|nr:CoA transferase [Dehalococcoidia bacterium]MBK6561353.1 CoA transferase [Dehalococcoidia bacterium]MCC6266858.1 CoA transferase [Dehalococcoidia bacterium]